MNENKNLTENVPDKSAFASMFRKSAARSVNGSSVIVDPETGKKRKKFAGRDIAVTYPNGVYIADFDIISVNDRANAGAKKSIGIYAFSDSPDGKIIGYTNGGANISRMIADWVSEIGNGDLGVTRDLYKQSAGRVCVKIEYVTDPTTGNQIQSVEVM